MRVSGGECGERRRGVSEIYIEREREKSEERESERTRERRRESKSMIEKRGNE